MLLLHPAAEVLRLARAVAARFLAASACSAWLVSSALRSVTALSLLPAAAAAVADSGLSEASEASEAVSEKCSAYDTAIRCRDVLAGLPVVEAADAAPTAVAAVLVVVASCEGCSS
jgi:hypothetical protein